MTLSALLSLIVGLAQAAPAPALLRPADAVRFALADITATATKDRRHIRYFWTGNQARQEDRREVVTVLSFAVNSLSRRRIIYPVLDPLPTSQGAVLRVDLRQYAIDPEAWDDLGSKGSGPSRSVKKLEQPEPYFHWYTRETTQKVTEEVVRVEPFQGEDGKTYTGRRVEKKSDPVTVRKLVHGPWLPPAEIAALVLACQTDFPIFRADWFISNALLPPAYQKFLGIGELKAFDELVRFRERDEDLAVKGIVLFSSEVALHNRSLLRTPTVLGYYWKSFDYFTSVDDQDLLDNVFKGTADASEYIASNLNGLQIYLLTNADGKVIDFADPNVAIDRSTPWENKLVWTGLSCMTCHSQGMKVFKEDVRHLAQVKNRVAALIKEDKDFERFTDLFGGDIDGFLKGDSGAYERAVMLATGGIRPEVNARNLQRVFIRYVQEPITLDTVALETGYTKAEIGLVLRGLKNPDHTLTQLVAGSPVRRDQLERFGMGQFMSILAPKKEPAP